jgi:WD40 repeat protein
MMSRPRFTLAGLLLWVSFAAIVLALVAPLIERVRRLPLRATSLAMSADGSTVAAALSNGRVHVWNSQTASEIAVLHEVAIAPARMPGVVDAHPWVTVSSNGQWLASGDAYRAGVAVWDLNGWDEAGQRQGPTLSSPSSTQAVFCPNQDLLALVNPSFVELRRLDDFDVSLPVQRLEEDDSVLRLAFSPRGDVLAVAYFSFPASLALYRVGEGERKKGCRLQGTLCQSIQFFSRWSNDCAGCKGCSVQRRCRLDSTVR